MAKFRKRVRKAVRRVWQSHMVQAVAEKLITAAILAAAARFSQSRTTKVAGRKARNVARDLSGEEERRQKARRKRSKKG